MIPQIIESFEKLPEDLTESGKFSALFKSFNDYMEASKIQGFLWEQDTYKFSHGSSKSKTKIDMKLDENTYLILVIRYKEMFGGGCSGGNEDIPFEVNG